MWTFNISDPKQLWVNSGIGNQLLNIGTGKALSVGVNGRSWSMDTSGRYINTRNTWEALDRQNGQVNGDLVQTFGLKDWIRQKWIQIPNNQAAIISGTYLFINVSLLFFFFFLVGG